MKNVRIAKVRIVRINIITDSVVAMVYLSYKIRKHTVPRHVRAGAVDKFLNFGFVDRRRLDSGCTR